MSGSPKYSSVSYSSARQQKLARERQERERRRAEELRRARERAQAEAARREAARASGLVGELEAQVGFIQRGLPFAPEAGDRVRPIQTSIAQARELLDAGRYSEVEAAVRKIGGEIGEVRREVEERAERLALRAATVDALSAGLRARGYLVGEAMARPDGTVAARATFAGQPGLDFAVVDDGGEDQLVLQRHDTDSPAAADAACPSLVDLHAQLQGDLADDGIELGRLRWDGQEPPDSYGAAATPGWGRADG